MGIWGPGIKDNDRALDFISNVIEDAMFMGQENEDFLIIADMMIKYDYVITENDLEIMNGIIDEEISRASHWSECSKSKRIEILNELLENLKKRRELIK